MATFENPFTKIPLLDSSTALRSFVNMIWTCVVGWLDHSVINVELLHVHSVHSRPTYRFSDSNGKHPT